MDNQCLGREVLCLPRMRFFCLPETKIFSPLENRQKGPKKEISSSKPSIFRCELLVSGRVSLILKFFKFIFKKKPQVLTYSLSLQKHLFNLHLEQIVSGTLLGWNDTNRSLTFIFR